MEKIDSWMADILIKDMETVRQVPILASVHNFLTFKMLNDAIESQPLEQLSGDQLRMGLCCVIPDLLIRPLLQRHAEFLNPHLKQLAAIPAVR